MKKTLSILLLSFVMLSCNWGDSSENLSPLMPKKEESVTVKIKDTSKRKSFTPFMFILLSGVSIYLLLENSRLKKKYKKLDKKIDGIEYDETLKGKIANKLLDDPELNQKINNQISTAIDDLKKKHKNIFSPKKEKAEKEQKPIISDKKTLPKETRYRYLKNLRDGAFSIESDNPNGSYFVLQNVRNDEAEFSYHADDKEAINKQVFKEGICEIVKGGYENAKKVNEISPGTVRFVDNKWIVQKPIQIELL